MKTDKNRISFGKSEQAQDRVVLIEAPEPTEKVSASVSGSARITDAVSDNGVYCHENAFLRVEITFCPYMVTVQAKGTLPDAWTALLSEIEKADAKEMRLYEQGDAPAAVLWGNDGSVELLGDDSVFGRLRWEHIRQMYWESAGFAGIDADGTVHGAGTLLPMRNEKAERLLCVEGAGVFTAVGGLQGPDGTVKMLNRFRKRCELLGERMERIQVLHVPTTGRCVWIGLACHTHRFLTSESGGTLSADVFGGSYTEEIDPNRYHQKIKNFIAVPCRWLAVLYQNGFLRLFGQGFVPGEILCEGVAAIEKEDGALIALLPRDISCAPTLEELPEETGEESPDSMLGEAADPAEYGAPIKEKLRTLLETPAFSKEPLHIRAAQRTADWLYLIHEDNRVTAQPMRGGEQIQLPWGGDRLPEITRIYPSLHGCFALCVDHTLYGFTRAGEEFLRWENVKAFTHSWSLAAALTMDGHALVYPFPKDNEGRMKEHFCNGHVTLVAESEEWDFSSVRHWHSLCALAVGDDVLYGLTEDGRVLSEGSEENGQRRVEEWREITDIACLDHVVLGLRRDASLCSAGQSFFANYAVGGWQDIVKLLPFQNSMASLLVGLCRDGSVAVAGRWSMDTYAYDNRFPVKSWQNIAELQSDGYYLTARTADDKMLYQSTPSPDGGDEPAEEHTFRWKGVCELLCREGWLLLRHRDGTVSWEGKKRPERQKRMTEAWQKVSACLLWRASPQRYYAVAITKDGGFLTDAAACDDPAEAAVFLACQHKLTGVQRIEELEQYLAILHDGGLTLLGWENNALRRYDFPGVCRIAADGEHKTLCMEYRGGRICSIGRTVYDSEADRATAVHRLLENDRTVGLIGLMPGGTPFLLTEQNDPRRDPRWYPLPELLQLLETRDAVQITPDGTMLLQDGRCIARGGALHRWSGIRRLSVCATHTVGITSFGTMLLHSPGGEGRSLEEYTDVRQVLCLPYTTLFLRQDGRLFLLCTRYAHMPCQPLPVSREIASIAATSGYLAILTRSGVLWCAQPDPLHNGWGAWEKHSAGIRAMRVHNDSLLLWRRDDARLLLAPTITSEQYSGMEPTMPEDETI